MSTSLLTFWCLDGEIQDVASTSFLEDQEAEMFKENGEQKVEKQVMKIEDDGQSDRVSVVSGHY